MSTLKIKVEEHPNKGMLSIHISKRISKKDYVTYYNQLRAEENEYDNGRTEELGYLAQALFAVDGVRELHFSQYEITIQKAEIFEWEEMIPDLIHVVKNMLRKEGDDFERMPDIKVTEEERERIKREWERASRNFDFDY